LFFAFFLLLLQNANGVVLGPSFVIGDYFVRSGHTGELPLRPGALLGVIGISVGVELLGEFKIGFLNFLSGRTFFDTEYGVVVFFEFLHLNLLSYSKLYIAVPFARLLEFSPHPFYGFGR